MSLRPAGQIPDFAATANFPAGPDPWSGQPTKADPGASLIAQGFTPHALLAAEEMNWLLNRLGLWLRYQDTIEVQTWSAENDPVLINNQNENVLIWSPQLWRYFIGGTDSTDQNTPKVYTSVNGETWTNDAAPTLTPDGFFQQYQLAGGDPGGKLLCWINHNSVSTNYLRSNAGVYAASAHGALQFNHVAVWITDRWVIGGVNATHPVMHTLDPADVQTSITLPGGGSVVAGIRMLATNGTAFVAVAAGTSDIWYGTPTGTITHVTPTFSGVPTGLVYVAPEALYWLTTDNGHVYTSPTGAAWTLRYTASGFTFPGGYSTQTGALASLGGLAVAQVLVTVPGGTVAGLAVGVDKGTVWALYVPPFGSPSGTGEALVGLAIVENRLAAVRRKGVSASDGIRLSYSLRVLA